jgi:hypothetical protein
MAFKACLREVKKKRIVEVRVCKKGRMGEFLGSVIVRYPLVKIYYFP